MKKLERRLNLTPVVALSLGAMLGSGLFVLPGVAAGLTGPSMWLAYLLAGLAVVPPVLCKAELSTAMSTSGGAYVYIEKAFGPFAGTFGGLAVWLVMLLKSSFALVGLSWYFRELVDVPEKPAALTVLAGIVTLNILGVKKVGRGQTWMVAISVVGLTGIGLWGLSSHVPALMEPAFTGGVNGLLAAVAVVYVSFAGVTGIAAVAEEVRNPARTLPLAMLISLAIATFLYITVTWLLAGHISAHLPVSEGGLIGDYHPLFSFAERVGGHSVALAIAVLGTLTMIAMANAGLLSASRFPFAMSRDGLMPSTLKVVHARHGTPVPAILLTGLIMACAVLFLDVPRIAKLASSMHMVSFIGMAVVVIVMRESSPQWYRPAYRLPLYPVLPVVGILAGCVLLYELGTVGVIGIGGVGVLASIIHMFYGRKQAARTGALQKMGSRPELLEGRGRKPSGVHAAVARGDVAVVVAVFDDSPPEPLVELGAGLAEGRQLAVFHLSEVPDQMELEDFGPASLLDAALERRTTNMGVAIGAHLHYQGVLCRDLKQQIYDIALDLNPDWVLFRWQDQGRHAVWVRNPMAWLISHLPCNVGVFKDAGVRIFQRILVVAEAGPHDQLLAHTADLLADISGGEISIVGHVTAQNDSHAERATDHYARALMRLVDAPADSLILPLEGRLQRLINMTAQYDLLIIEEPVYRPFHTSFRRSFDDKLIDGARCSVLRLRIPHAAAPEDIDQRTGVLHEGDALLCRMLDPRLVIPEAPCARKRDALREIGKRYEAVYGVDAREVVAGLWHRERQHNSLLGGGVALCMASVAHAKTHHVGLLRLETPIDFNSPGAEFAEMILFCIAPSPDHHVLEALWLAVQRLVIRVDLVGSLDGVHDPDAVVAVLTALCQEHAED